MTYTFNGFMPAEIVIQNHQNEIVAAVRRVIPDEELSAIVMIGGYGRQEGAFVEIEGEYAPYNDYDYFVVMQNVSSKKAHKILQKIPDLEITIGIEVDFYPLLKNDLKTLEFSLMNAEMQVGHRVIWGDKNVLSSMQRMPLSKVPLSEFTRMMMNRGCLLLINYCDPGNPHVSKYINKAWLAIGDSVLKLLNSYEVSYLKKTKKISAILGESRISKCYERAVNIRLRPDLYSEWSLDDLDEVTDIWTETLSQLERKNGKFLSHTSLIDLVKNLIRNLSDRRLWCLNTMVWTHPRQRILANLKLLLREQRRDTWHGDAKSLLVLWQSYS